MSTSVGTKPRKKQLSLSLDAAHDRALEQALLGLENACHRILDGNIMRAHGDIELTTWQHRFQNVVTPVSLALREYKGPRHFHYHYRHRQDDESIRGGRWRGCSQFCRETLRQCRSDLVGLDNDQLIALRGLLENALLNFLLRYRDHQKQLDK